MSRIEVYPFARIGHSGQRYPDWIRAMEGRNGVYLIREQGAEEIAYIGESHSDRLYGTLTRHFQRWSPKFNTSGPTYARGDVEVAVILVAKTRTPRLQNDLICALTPRDNRLVCDAEHAPDAADDPSVTGLDDDIGVLIDAIFSTADEQPEHDDDVPF